MPAHHIQKHAHLIGLRILSLRLHRQHLWYARVAIGSVATTLTFALEPRRLEQPLEVAKSDHLSRINEQIRVKFSRLSHDAFSAPAKPTVIQSPHSEWLCLLAKRLRSHPLPEFFS